MSLELYVTEYKEKCRKCTNGRTDSDGQTINHWSRLMDISSPVDSVRDCFIVEK